MKRVLNSTLKDCKWDSEECSYPHNVHGITDEGNNSSKGNNEEEEECDTDNVLGSSLPFPGPVCLIPAIPVLRLLSAILSHSARQEVLKTLATDINQSAPNANFKGVTANAIASWLLGC